MSETTTDKEFLPPLGEWLEHKGWNQTQFARAMGLHKSQVSRWITGDRKGWKGELADRAAEVFGVTIDDFKLGPAEAAYQREMREMHEDAMRQEAAIGVGATIVEVSPTKLPLEIRGETSDGTCFVVEDVLGNVSTVPKSRVLAFNAYRQGLRG